MSAGTEERMVTELMKSIEVRLENARWMDWLYRILILGGSAVSAVGLAFAVIGFMGTQEASDVSSYWMARADGYSGLFVWAMGAMVAVLAWGIAEKGPRWLLALFGIMVIGIVVGLTAAQWGS